MGGGWGGGRGTVQNIWDLSLFHPTCPTLPLVDANYWVASPTRVFQPSMSNTLVDPSLSFGGAREKVLVIVS